MASCFAIRQTDTMQPALAPNAAPSGYGPGDLQSAYNLASAAASAGGGATVGIVDANDDPNAESDLATYRSTYGLPACTSTNGCFRKADQNGGTNYPGADSGWAGEISLDLDMVSAVCPNCHILLVEANSASLANLGAAENTAVALGAKYVSNSYGGGESSSETNSDASYYHHPGVAITASTGDNGYGASYPATSQDVTAVGGTSLNSSGSGFSESAWSGAGSGCSAYEGKPGFQSGVSTGCANRAVADVSAVADPQTGVAVYQTYGGNGWAVYGGTSASSPIIASVYALAGNAGQTPNADPYAHTSDLNDVTSGSNGSCSQRVQCNAGAGWDGPTGLGTPNGVGAFSTGGGGTPPPPTGNCSGQKFANPGFESGNSGWTASTGVIGQYGSQGEPAHSGTGVAWLDGYGRTHTDTLSQQVSIPSGCHATLSFYVHIDTQESGSTPYDTLTVRAGSTTLGTLSNVDARSGYVQKSVDVSSYAGKTVTIGFTGHEDSSLATSFVLDDTALTLS
ncbi:MAG: S53 family peptidase [Sciscionella sp.]